MRALKLALVSLTLSLWIAMPAEASRTVQAPCNGGTSAGMIASADRLAKIQQAIQSDAVLGVG